MNEERGDLWSFDAPVKVITTNGTINARGLAVMGRGVALQATERFPGIARMLAAKLKAHGLRTEIVLEQLTLDGGSLTVVAFPVKFHWHEAADKALIRRSATQLVELTDEYHWSKVAMVRPGCGNGELSWHEVKPLIRSLDSRFTIVEKYS